MYTKPQMLAHKGPALKIRLYYTVMEKLPGDFRSFYKPNWAWEREVLEEIKTMTEQGDTVVEIGGGVGVCTLWAAKQVGETGKVITYEAAQMNVEKLNQTIEHNSISNIVELNHAVVGTPVEVWGDSESAEVLAPSDIPECDVLLLDCEGAEMEIIRNLHDRPGVIIVETHGILGSPTDSVVDTLENEGYSISRIKPHVPEEDIDVVSAQLITRVGNGGTE